MKIASQLWVVALLLGRSAPAADGDAQPRRWAAPEEWLVSCAGDWVYSPPEESPSRQQACTFLRFGPSGAAVWFQAGVVESTSTGDVSLSSGDGFLIAGGRWSSASDGRIKLELQQASQEKSVGGVRELKPVWLAPNGRHLIDEARKLFFEPLAFEYPGPHGELREVLRGEVCRGLDGAEPAAKVKAARRAAGCGR